MYTSRQAAGNPNRTYIDHNDLLIGRIDTNDDDTEAIAYYTPDTDPNRLTSIGTLPTVRAAINVVINHHRQQVKRAQLDNVQ